MMLSTCRRLNVLFQTILIGHIIFQCSVKASPVGTITIGNISCLHDNLHGDIKHTINPKMASSSVVYFKIKIVRGNQTFKEVELAGDHVVLRKQCPKAGECLTLSANIEVIKNITQKYESKSSNVVKFCEEHAHSSKETPMHIKTSQTMGKEIVINVHSNSSMAHAHGQHYSRFYVAKIQYTNKTQTILRFNGIFKTKKLKMDECVQVMFRVGFLLSYEKTSSRVKYSKWNTQKTYCVTVDEDTNLQYEAEREILHIVLSCTIPALTIVALIVWAFISYYRKRGVDEDLQISIQSFEEGLLDSNRSSHCSPNRGNTNTLLLTEQAPKKSGNDDKLYSSNEEELGRILSCSGTDADLRESKKVDF
eukprot:TCONS_00007180-protein